MDWLLALTDKNLILIAASAGSFFVGVVFSRIVFGTRKSKIASEDPRNHRIRQLEVDLRLAERRLEEYDEQLATKTYEVDQSMATVHDLNAVLSQRESEVEVLRSEVKGAVKKTRELRQELTDRAAETIREHVRAEEAQTELEVVRAGSDALISEFNLVHHDESGQKGD